MKILDKDGLTYYTGKVKSALTDYYTKTETNTLLDNKVGFTDYATSSKGGVFKTSNDVNTDVYNGVLFVKTKTYAQYQAQYNDAFIGKGTLENVITGKGLVSNTDYATNSKGGVIKISANTGTGIDTNGYLNGTTRTYEQYTSGYNSLLISKGTLENVLTERIGSIATAIDLINGESV